MMKKSFRMILSLVLMMLMVMSLAATADAAGSTVTYKGVKDVNANSRFILAPGSEYTTTDLFTGFKNVMPGDTLTETITFKNEAEDCDYVNLYLKAIPHGADNPLSPKVAEKTTLAEMNKFLSQLTMTVTCNGKVINDALNGGLAAEQFLGKVQRGQKLDLTVKLEVPLELGNEYADKIGEVDWVFLVNAYNESVIVARKIWSDGYDKHAQESVTVNLLKNGQVYQTQELKADNQWIYNFEHPTTDDKWEIKEVNVPTGYKVTYQTEGNVTTILNQKDGTPAEEPLDITVKKVWSGDKGKKRPTSVTVTLYNGKEAYDSQILSDKNGWTYTWEDPDLYGNWQVVETKIPKGYVPSYKNKDGVVTITNSRSLIQTGQLNWPIWVLGGFGIAFIILGETMLMKKKKRNNA